MKLAKPTRVIGIPAMPTADGISLLCGEKTPSNGAACCDVTMMAAPVLTEVTILICQRDRDSSHEKRSFFMIVKMLSRDRRPSQSGISLNLC